MIQDTLKARLNLNAVLRNLEVLPTLDEKAAEIIRDWSVSIRFRIRGDIAPRLAFSNGKCTYAPDAVDPADILLFLWSPAHLNAMFDNKANPIPLKGFSKLGFLKNAFPKITERLEYFLKPDEAALRDTDYVRVNIALSLYTGVFAVCELAQFDPIASQVIQQMPPGTLQLSVLPDGPEAHIVYDGQGHATAFRGAAKNPTASIAFRDRTIASRLFNGQLDGFGAVALGDIKLKGLIPLIDNTNLILDRIPLYLQ